MDRTAVFFRRLRIIAHKTRLVKKIFAAVFAFLRSAAANIMNLVMLNYPDTLRAG